MPEALLRATGLCRSYRTHGGKGLTIAVDHVDLCLGAHESVAVVGESGAGKSTLLRLLLALERPSSGTVHFKDQPISRLPERLVRPLRRHFQPVFQDPTTSLNGRLRVAGVIAEPLVAHGLGTAVQRRQRVLELLAEVGLPAAAAQRKPDAFSTGERQRIALARALASEPELLLLDEPVASLDLSIQAEILALIRRLREQRQLAVLLVSHDLQVVAALCDRVMVLFAGMVVEEGSTGTVLQQPGHPYTAELLAAAPQPDPEWRPPESSPTHGPHSTTGCPYRLRCILAHDRCAEKPALKQKADGRRVACWAAFDS